MLRDKVLIIGDGGREFSLVKSCLASPHVREVLAAPGRNSWESCFRGRKFRTIPFGERIVNFAQDEKVALTIVGPENPLMNGVADIFEERGLTIFGPKKRGAKLEGSKKYGKWVARKYGVPVARCDSFSDFQPAMAFALTLGFPVVVKADLPKAGKGVSICYSEKELEIALQEKLQKGEEVVIENYLGGENDEMSVHFLFNGQNTLLFPLMKDHKFLKGKMTGGMAAICPIPEITKPTAEEVDKEIVQKTVRGLKGEEIDFRGLVYPGLINLRLSEYNVRFGDPEAQAVLAHCQSDIYPVLMACAKGERMPAIQWHNGYSVNIVIASKNYPDSYSRGDVIRGLERVKILDGVEIVHAGTWHEGRKYYTDGGRILGVVAWGETLFKALARAYAAIREIRFDGMQYREWDSLTYRGY